MTRSLFLILAFLMFPLAASAIEAPPGQTRIDANSVLRGRFVQEHQLGTAKGAMRSSGHFVVAPSRGLIWSVEKPMATSTIITPNGAVQDIGGFAMKLPIRNLRSLYEMVGGALAGDWNGLEKDFVIKRSGNANHWKMILTPRQTDRPKLPYDTITVSGSPFVENILMTRTDGSYDAMNFTDEVLSPAQLTATENAVFNEVKPQVSKRQAGFFLPILETKAHYLYRTCRKARQIFVIHTIVFPTEELILCLLERALYEFKNHGKLTQLLGESLPYKFRTLTYYDGHMGYTQGELFLLHIEARRHEKWPVGTLTPTTFKGFITEEDDLTLPLRFDSDTLPVKELFSFLGFEMSRKMLRMKLGENYKKKYSTADWTDAISAMLEEEDSTTPIRLGKDYHIFFNANGKGGISIMPLNEQPVPRNNSGLRGKPRYLKFEAR